MSYEASFENSVIGEWDIQAISRPRVGSEGGLSAKRSGSGSWVFYSESEVLGPGIRLRY